MAERLKTEDIKRINRYRVLRYICHHGRVSLQAIADALHLSKPTVLQVYRELEKEGLVREDGEFDSIGGRRAMAVKGIYDAGYALGIDMTRNHVSFVLTDLSERVLHHTRQRIPFRPGEDYSAEVDQRMRSFLCACGLTDMDNLLGIGISVPGIVNEEQNTMGISKVLGIGNLTCEQLLPGFGAPFRLLNDANAAAAAEYFRYTEREDFRKTDMFYLSLSNSVGGALLVGDKKSGDLGMSESVYGRMYYGMNWHSCEAGHLRIYPKGKICYCGRQGCADSYCSALVLADLAGGRLEDFFQELEEGRNAAFRRAMETYLDDLAILVDGIRMICDCEIVLGGYVGNFIEPFLPQLRQRLAPINIFEAGGDYVRAAHYQTEASAYGAAIRIIEDFFQSEDKQSNRS